MSKLSDYVNATGCDFPDMPHIIRTAECWELAGCEGISPYTRALNEIDAAIGELKRFRRSVQEMATHEHEWGPHDICVICGADGRA